MTNIGISKLNSWKFIEIQLNLFYLHKNIEVWCTRSRSPRPLKPEVTLGK